MKLTTAVLGIGGIPFLGGCMMAGGWGHAGVPGTYGQGPTGPAWTIASPQRAEATSDGVTLVLWIPASTAGTAVTIAAQLRADATDLEPADAEIWLSIERPGGRVDDLPMHRERSSAAAMYRTLYEFAGPGRYVVTAAARLGAGTGVRTVSVTTEAEVGAAPVYRRDSSVPPAAIIGSVGGSR